MKKLLFAALLATFSLCAQEGLVVSPTDGPPHDAYTKYFFTASTTTYACQTKAVGESTTQSVSAASNASPTTITITNHGFSTSANPTVTLSGATGNWTTLNSTFIATVLDANTLTVPLDTTTFGSLTGTVVLQTNAARLTRPLWVVLRLISDVSGNPVASSWAVGGNTNICANRATLSYQ